MKVSVKAWPPVLLDGCTSPRYSPGGLSRSLPYCRGGVEQSQLETAGRIRTVEMSLRFPNISMLLIGSQIKGFLKIHR